MVKFFNISYDKDFIYTEAEDWDRPNHPRFKCKVSRYNNQYWVEDSEATSWVIGCLFNLVLELEENNTLPTGRTFVCG
jgi:hypothetical protein